MDDSTVNRAFVMALLLTGDAGFAESAVLEAIDSVPADGRAHELLTEATIGAALRMGARSNGHLYSTKLLPPELWHVLRLHPRTRVPFVLRLLAGWPAGRTAKALHSDPSTVSVRISQASLELAFAATSIEVASGSSLS